MSTLSGYKTVPPQMAIVMAGITKVFVGEVIELARDCQRELDPDMPPGAPLLPRHIREAHRRSAPVARACIVCVCVYRVSVYRVCVCLYRVCSTWRREKGGVLGCWFAQVCA